MTIYTSICIGLPPWMHKALDKVTKAFPWVSSDEVLGGKCLLAWQKVQHPLRFGGLGILDLCLFESALHMRWFHEDKATTSFFEASTIAELGDGAPFLF
jgi:hypothetical protein